MFGGWSARTRFGVHVKRRLRLNKRNYLIMLTFLKLDDKFLQTF